MKNNLTKFLLLTLILIISGCGMSEKLEKAGIAKRYLPYWEKYFDEIKDNDKKENTIIAYKKLDLDPREAIFVYEITKMIPPFKNDDIKFIKAFKKEGCLKSKSTTIACNKIKDYVKNIDNWNKLDPIHMNGNILKELIQSKFPILTYINYKNTGYKGSISYIELNSINITPNDLKQYIDQGLSIHFNIFAKLKNNGFSINDIKKYHYLAYRYGNPKHDANIAQSILLKKYKISFDIYSTYFHFTNTSLHNRNLEKDLPILQQVLKLNIGDDEFHEWWRVLSKKTNREYDALHKNYKALFTWKELGYSPSEANDWFLSYNPKIIKKLDKYKKAGFTFKFSKKCITNNWSVSKAKSILAKQLKKQKDLKDRLTKIVKKHCTTLITYDSFRVGVTTPYQLMDKCIIVNNLLMSQSISKNKGLYQMDFNRKMSQTYIEVIFKNIAPKYVMKPIVLKVIDTDVLDDNTRVIVGKQLFTID